ncbi:hypothetical protein, partial [Acinetobacter baumannii]|uniref:hypothetical protein n=1 Tax=Acinetobacter baumannii TaxID=470 RepID=UPI00339849B0
MFKIKNYITLSLAIFTLSLVFYFDSFSKVTTSFEAILADSKKKELLEKFSEFDISKKLFLYVDKLDTNSLKKIQTLEQKLLN